MPIIAISERIKIRFTSDHVNMRQFSFKLLASAILYLLPTMIWAAPPPPVPPGYIDLSLSLIHDYEEGDIASYDAQFAPDVQVIENGKLLPVGRSEVDRLFRKWRTQGLSFSVLGSAVGGAQTLVFERVSNMPIKLSPVAGHNIDCCWWTRTVLYEINNSHKIFRMLITDAQQASNIKVESGG